MECVGNITGHAGYCEDILGCVYKGRWEERENCVNCWGLCRVLRGSEQGSKHSCQGCGHNDGVALSPEDPGVFSPSRMILPGYGLVWQLRGQNLCSYLNSAAASGGSLLNPEPVYSDGKRESQMLPMPWHPASLCSVTPAAFPVPQHAASSVKHRP